MTDTQAEPDTGATRTQETTPAPALRKKQSISMHEGVPVWHDCCCCEAEPYWAELAEEMGIDLDPSWDADAQGG